MRVDLFLKRSRIIKQREAAKKACDRGMVSIAGKPAKPGHQVAAKDIVVVKWPHRRLEFEVMDVPGGPDGTGGPDGPGGNVSKEKAQSLYHVLRDERLSDDPFGFEES